VSETAPDMVEFNFSLIRQPRALAFRPVTPSAKATVTIKVARMTDEALGVPVWKQFCGGDLRYRHESTPLISSSGPGITGTGHGTTTGKSSRTTSEAPSLQASNGLTAGRGMVPIVSRGSCRVVQSASRNNGSNVSMLATSDHLDPRSAASVSPIRADVCDLCHGGRPKASSTGSPAAPDWRIITPCGQTVRVAGHRDDEFDARARQFRRCRRWACWLRSLPGVRHRDPPCCFCSNSDRRSRNAQPTAITRGSRRAR
jgi:hypothetical protein